MASRKEVLAATSILYKTMHDKVSYATDNEASNDLMEASLVETVKNAQKSLDDFRASRALRMALDSILPGWVYIDASDYLPKELWGVFVSDDPAEHLAWLKEHSVPSDVANDLVKRYFEKA